MTSERRPLKGGSSNRFGAGGNASNGASSRRPVSPKPERRSGRNAPGDDEEEAHASAFRKVMFYGTGVLVIVCIFLVIYKWGAITQAPAPPQKKVVIREDLQLEEVKKIEEKAARMFADAKRIKDDAERNKAIRAAMDTLSGAIEKAQAMSEQPKYQGEDYDQVFGPLIDRMMQEMKTYRDAIKVGAGR